MKLSINLIPQSSWCSNLRSLLTKKEWEMCKSYSKSKNNNKCEICNGQGKKWKTECHEEWEFDEVKNIQKLTKITALCPSCHEVKHIGLANANNRFNEAFNHFLKINEVSNKEGWLYIQKSFQDWERRSNLDWELDCSYLLELSNEIILSEKTKEKLFLTKLQDMDKQISIFNLN